ncbi:MAG: insulinase family protein [Eggerthellales bacterium]|nr:insulinase family protein [Eggerthellales bacterium]
MTDQLNLQNTGFSLVETTEVPEISATAYVMRHDATAARLLFLKCDDENKAFSISFRTPPQDSTGVFHILEHSVLCGSNKFPVKEPFVNLLKTSMQTFLNAMTFPDKTMYPVASTNDQDLLNLADVYLDAVFHPAIYQKETIFQQEGWHYEREGEEGLAYNGVVFNEMKGALSEPEDMLCNLVNAGLFPHSPYGFESGGLPSDIPNLTYQQFLDEHRRHYSPANSYIILYGDINLAPLLALIDQHLNAAPTWPDMPARTIALQEPVVNLGGTYEMDIPAENACCGVGYVMGDACDFTQINAMGVLLDALTGSNEAPLKRALLNEGISDDVDFVLRDSMAQPYVLAYAKGIAPGTLDTFHQLVTKHVTALVEKGIDPELIEAALSHEEFILRERDFGYADGVINAMTALSGWLYDDNCPIEALRYEECFAFLRQQISQGYFERLAQRVFLQNNHIASGEIVAATSQNTAEAERLESAARTMGAEGLAAVDQTVAALRAAQEAPDSPAALATLPQLSPADITDARPWASFGLDPAAPVPCLRHTVETHGIAYFQLYYNLDIIPYQELPYAAILAYVLGKLSTPRWSAAQIDTLVQSKMGTLAINPKIVCKDNDVNSFFAGIGVGASCLEPKIANAMEIVNEVLARTDFSDVSRIKAILTQLRIQLEQSFTGNGHSVAMGRVGSYLRKGSLVGQQMNGIDLYLFLKDLLSNFDQRANELTAKLQAMAQIIFNSANLLASFTGSQVAYETFLAALPAAADVAAPAVLEVPQPEIKREAFVVPTDVTYTALGYDRRLLPDAPAYHGSQMMVSNAASLDWIWNEVRVKGGAYGGGLRIPAKNDICFYSYRDPRIDETIARYRATAQWLAEFAPDQREFEGYVVSTVANIDNPQKARAIIVAQNNAFLQGRDANFRLQARGEVLASTPEQMRAFAATLEAAASQPCYCTVGNKGIIEKARTDFNVVELF